MLSNKIEKRLLNEFQQEHSTQVFGNIANNLRRSLLYVPELLEARFLRQLSASIPDGPGPLLVLIAAFLIISSSIHWNLIG